MTVVGVLLVVIAALVLIAVLFGGADDPAVLDVGLFEISTSAMGVFLLGAATVLVFVSGLEMMRSGLRRALRRRRELKEARAVMADQDRRDRRTSGPGEPGTGPTSTGDTASGPDPAGPPR